MTCFLSAAISLICPILPRTTSVFCTRKTRENLMLCCSVALTPIMSFGNFFLRWLMCPTRTLTSPPWTITRPSPLWPFNTRGWTSPASILTAPRSPWISSPFFYRRMPPDWAPPPLTGPMWMLRTGMSPSRNTISSCGTAGPLTCW